MFVEGVLRLLDAARAHRLKHVADRSDVAGDDDRTAGTVGHFTGDARAGDVELSGALLEMVQRETDAIRAEGVGQQNVRAGVDEALVDALHRVRTLDVPRRAVVALAQAEQEKIRAHRAVGDDDVLFFQQPAQQIAHRVLRNDSALPLCAASADRRIDAEQG